MENRFNLLDEPWVPIEGVGKVSLRDVFCNYSYVGLAGNPIQKMAVYKLLFLIAQRACDITTEEELVKKGVDGISKSCLEYLDAHRDCFFLYGDKPFLQYPQLRDNENIETKTIYVDYMPDLASENDSIVKQTQTKQHITDSDKALFIVALVSYALGGKRTMDPRKYLSEQDERAVSSKASPSLSDGISGLVQTLLLGNNVIETVLLNYFTKKELEELNLTSLVLSIVPPWERMPTFLQSDFNYAYKNSFIAWYMPMTRAVCLTKDNGIKYCEELCYKEAWIDPFLTVNSVDNKKIKVDILKRPWNQIQALLSEVYNVESDRQKCKCLAVNKHYLRARKYTDSFSIWTGGLKLRTNRGDQSIKQEDDYLESVVTFNSEDLGDSFFSRYCNIVNTVNNYGDSLKKKIYFYRKQLNIGDTLIKDSMFEFWHEMSNLSERFVSAAEDGSKDLMNKLFVDIYNIERSIYDDYCPHGTSRQLLAWAKNRP